MNEWMNEWGLMFVLRRVILIYPPVTHLKRNKPITSSYLGEFLALWFIYKKTTNKSQLWRVLWLKKCVGLFHIRSFSHIFILACKTWTLLFFLGMQLVSYCKCLTWQGAHAMCVCLCVCVHVCSCVFVSSFLSASLSASCRVSCWPSSPPLTLSSDCFLSAVPDRK